MCAVSKPIGCLTVGRPVDPLQQMMKKKRNRNSGSIVSDICKRIWQDQNFFRRIRATPVHGINFKRPSNKEHTS